MPPKKAYAFFYAYGLVVFVRLVAKLELYILIVLPFFNFAVKAKTVCVNTELVLIDIIFVLEQVSLELILKLLLYARKREYCNHPQNLNYLV